MAVDVARLKRMAKARAKEEFKTNRKTDFATLKEERAARKRIDQAYEDALALIDECQVPPGVPEKTRKGWEATREAYLAAIEHNLTTPAAPHMRAARLQGYRESNEARGDDLRKAAEMPGAEGVELVKKIAEAAEKVADFLHTLAKDPAKYYEMAVKFINHDIIRAAQANGIKLVSKMTFMETEKFIEVLKSTAVTRRIFAGAGKLMESAAAFLGALQVGIDTVVVVFKALSDSGHWAPIAAKGYVGISVVVGLTEVAGTAAAEAAIASALGPIFLAATGSAEVPPVAIALAAAGIVLIVALVVTELFDVMTDWLFGLRPMPRSMMTSTFTSTVGETASSTSVSTITHTS